MQPVRDTPLTIILRNSLLRRYMNAFFQSLRERVGSRAFRIFKLHAVHGWHKAQIARHLGLHRGNVGRQIDRVRRAAHALMASLGIDDPKDLPAAA